MGFFRGNARVIIPKHKPTSHDLLAWSWYQFCHLWALNFLWNLKAKKLHKFETMVYCPYSLYQYFGMFVGEIKLMVS